MPTLRIQEVGKYIYSDQLSLCIQYEKVDENFVLSRQKNEIMLDVLKVNFPFTLRPLTAGDRFRPFGMTGSKLVSDYLTDEKVNVLDKKPNSFSQIRQEKSFGLWAEEVAKRVE